MRPDPHRLNRALTAALVRRGHVAPTDAAVDFCGDLPRTLGALNALRLLWAVGLTPDDRHEAIVWQPPDYVRAMTAPLDTFAPPAALATALVQCAVALLETADQAPASEAP
jgi:hypothetical protein